MSNTTEVTKIAAKNLVKFTGFIGAWVIATLIVVKVCEMILLIIGQDPNVAENQAYPAAMLVLAVGVIVWWAIDDARFKVKMKTEYPDA